MLTANGSSTSPWALVPIVILVSIMAAIFWTIRRWQRRIAQRTLTAIAERPNEPTTVRCGARVNGVSVTWPLAAMTFDEHSADLFFPLRRPIHVPRDEVIRVTTRRGSGWVRFETISGRFDHALFASRGVSDALRARGWPVES